MKLRVLAIGRPRLAYARSGIAEYAQRIARHTRFEIEYLRASSAEKESRTLIARSEGSLRIALDERGELCSSAEFAGKIAGWQRSSQGRVDFLLGGADGHTDELRASSQALWALSPLTFQHELALVVLLEQIYRAFSILAGTPYHRA